MAHQAAMAVLSSHYSRSSATGAGTAPRLAATPRATPSRSARQLEVTAYAHTGAATAASRLDLPAPSRGSNSMSSTSGHLTESFPSEPLLACEVVKGALVRFSSSASNKVPTAVLVHGILGKRQNMLPFARRLVEGFPSWQVVVVDLRCHGESAALSPHMHGVHGVEAAAADVIRLLSALKLFPEMLIGHSFGGKAVLEMTKAWSAAAHRVPRPVQVWVLDALPGQVRSGDMGGADHPADLISTLQAVPLPVPSRHWLISHLEALGFSLTVATWASTNLIPLANGAPGLGWGFDLAGISQMFRSYENADLWPLLASPADGVKLSFVKAERSTFRWGGGDEVRIRSLGHDVHELPQSGHWVHTDNPDGLFDILSPSFGGAVDLHMQRSPPGSSPGSPRVANNITPSPSATASIRQLQGLMM